MRGIKFITGHTWLILESYRQQPSRSLKFKLDLFFRFPNKLDLETIKLQIQINSRIMYLHFSNGIQFKKILPLMFWRDSVNTVSCLTRSFIGPMIKIWKAITVSPVYIRMHIMLRGWHFSVFLQIIIMYLPYFLKKCPGTLGKLAISKSKNLNNVPFLCTKLLQKRRHYSRGDIIQGRILFKEIRYLLSG